MRGGEREESGTRERDSEAGGELLCSGCGFGLPAHCSN